MKHWKRWLFCVVAIGAIALTLWNIHEAQAHPGGLAKDGCHNDKAAGELHYHVEGTSERAGLCERRDDKTYYITVVERVVEVEKEVPVEAAPTEQCETLRERYITATEDWWGDPGPIGLEAIEAGCW